MDFEKKVIVDVDGFIEKGKQFDLDLRLPEDERNVVYGVIKDHHGEPVKDAVVKLIEVCKDERKPVSFKVDLKKCIFCGNCQYYCPVKAIKLGEDFELGVNSSESLTLELIKEKECN